MLKSVKAREILNQSAEKLKSSFTGYLDSSLVYDSQFINLSQTQVMAIGGFSYKVPALKELAKNAEVSVYFDKLSVNGSHLFQIEKDSVKHLVCMEK